MRGADRQVASADRPAVDGRIAQAGGSGGGRVALVTGASSGLGRALSVELTDRGCRVVAELSEGLPQIRWRIQPFLSHFQIS